MTFDDLRKYLDNAGSRYGYVGTFDNCNILVNTGNGLVPVESVHIQIGNNGIGCVILSDEEPTDDIG